MRKEEITQEIIEKAKELAEYWRMEIYEGCWVYDKLDNVLDLVFGGRKYWFDRGFLKTETFIPIPSISDCLEKLRELKPKSPVRMKVSIAVLEYLMNKTTFAKFYKTTISAILEVLKND